MTGPRRTLRPKLDDRPWRTVPYRYDRNAKPIVPAEGAPIYNIAVAARILGISRARLKRWEAFGLLNPVRDAHQNRFYSDHDIAEARVVKGWLDAGLNLMGVVTLLAHTEHTPMFLGDAFDDDLDYDANA